jgi:hypothetical protein
MTVQNTKTGLSTLMLNYILESIENLNSMSLGACRIKSDVSRISLIKKDILINHIEIYEF